MGNATCHGPDTAAMNSAPSVPCSPFPVPHSPSQLYKAIDALNKRYGKGKVFSAAEGLGDRSWKMKRSKLSKRPTTRWDELMTVR